MYWIGQGKTYISNMKVVGQAGGAAWVAEASGSYVYVGTGPKVSAFQVVDEKAVLQGQSEPLSDIVFGLVLGEGYAYALTTNGLHVLDIRKPAAPTALGWYKTTSAATSIAKAGKRILVGDAEGTVHLVDVTDPAAPKAAGLRRVSPNRVLSVAVAGEYALVGIMDGGLRVLDLRDPTSLAEMGAYPGLSNIVSMAVAADYAYALSIAGTLTVVAIGNPNTLKTVAAASGAREACVAVQDGYAYVVHSNGMRIIDLTVSATSALKTVTDYAGTPWGVTLQNGYAYLPDGDGLRILDIRDPGNPVQLRREPILGSGSRVALNGRYAYVASSAGIALLDVGDPRTPKGMGFQPLEDCRTQGLAVAGSLAYVACRDRGLRIVDFSNPIKPRLLVDYRDVTYVVGVAAVGGLACVAHADGYLHVVDVSQPATPKQVSVVKLSRKLGEQAQVALAGGYAYLAGSSSGTSDHTILQIVDIRDSANPRQVGSFSARDYIENVVVADGTAFVGGKTGCLAIIDVSSPSVPRERVCPAVVSVATNLALEYPYLYVSGYFLALGPIPALAGIKVFDVRAPAGMVEAGYLAPPGPDFAGRDSGIAASGGYLYATSPDLGLQIVRVGSSGVP